jgi:hypothetical protein
VIVNFAVATYFSLDPAFAVLGKRSVTTTVDQSALTDVTLSG